MKDPKGSQGRGRLAQSHPWGSLWGVFHEMNSLKAGWNGFDVWCWVFFWVEIKLEPQEATNWSRAVFLGCQRWFSPEIISRQRPELSVLLGEKGGNYSAGFEYSRRFSIPLLLFRSRKGRAGGWELLIFQFCLISLKKWLILVMVSISSELQGWSLNPALIPACSQSGAGSQTFLCHRAHPSPRDGYTPPLSPCTWWSGVEDDQTNNCTTENATPDQSQHLARSTTGSERR